MEFKGKNVVYVGGFGGIGQKCVKELLKKEVKTLIIFELADDEEFLKSLQVRYPSSNVDYIHVDLAKSESIESAYKRAMDKMGQLDVVINGSGVLNDSQIDLSIAVNLTGVIHSSMIALKYMHKSKGGHGGAIVNISSTSGLDPFPSCAIYSAAKFGVNAFTRSLGHDRYYDKTGVRFITICPGGTVTPIVHRMDTKYTMPEYPELFTGLTKKFSIQTAAEFAQMFIQVLEMAENGSVWLLDGGNFRKIEFPVMCHSI